MDIFISWSGERSKAIAKALHEWIPHVIQFANTWISTSDIHPGERWNKQVAEQLEASRVGIICLTPENLNSPWLLFEAGALSKTLDMTFVCPYLFEVAPQELHGPLSQFQSTSIDKEETRKLIQTINLALGEQALEKDRLDKSFNRWWPDLKKELKKVPSLEVEIDRPARDSVLRETSETFKQIARG